MVRCLRNAVLWFTRFHNLPPLHRPIVVLQSILTPVFHFLMLKNYGFDYFCISKWWIDWFNA
jgi:hypothetical protein